VDGIAEAKQIFGQIGAVLPGNAGNERHAPLRILNRHIHSNHTQIIPCPLDHPRRTPQHSTLAKSNTKVD